MVLTVLFSLNLCFAQGKSVAPKNGGEANSTETPNQKTLKDIDQLIEETEYSAALIELSDYLRGHPDELDSVQKRIDQIMNARNQYIVLANQLIDVMEKEPENAQKKLEIIAKLETVEKHPTEEQLSFIRQAKIAAQFTYYRAQFRRIVEESSASVDKGEFSQAVSQIQKGFTMYREEFYEDNPASVTTTVTTLVNGINNLCRDYSNEQDRLRNAYNAFINAVNSGNYNDASRAYNNFNNEMQTLANIRNAVYKNANSLKDIFAQLQKKNPELTEASYLPFVFRFTLGTENNDRSGIIGAMDTQFVNYVEGAKPVINAAIASGDIGRIDQTNVATVRENELPRSKITALSNFADLGKTVNAMYGKLDYEVKYKKDYPNYIASMDYVKTVAKTLDDSYIVLNKYQKTNDTLKTIQKPADAVEGIRSKNSYASMMIACSKEYDDCAFQADALLKQEWFTSYPEKVSQSAKVKNNKDANLEYINFDTYYSVLNKTLYDVCRKASEHQWKETSSYFASAAGDICNHYQEEYKKADELLQTHYPKEALALISQTEKELNADADTLIQCRDILVKSSSNRSAFASEEKAVVEGVNRMNAFKKESSDTAAKCNEEILLSQRAINEAELRYNQALNAYNRGDYTNARKSIEQASLKYKEALDHQEDQSLRESSDKKLFALGQQVNDAENKLIVAEVRKLKNQAKNEYYNGNFEKAESTLAKAKSRWAVTNGDEEDEEIKNLFAMVETALSMKTGRVIPPTAPLYPEMSQLLSIAHQYYDKGSKQIKKGNEEEGKETLDLAKKKLQEVQLVYPLNQEASILTLRIDQILDEATFQEMFERKVRNAKENYKIAEKQQEAYRDLCDLYEINPKYPGLKNLIYQVELELGFKQKPVDTTAITKSQALTREAQAIVNSAGKNETQLRNALAKLDEAIVLNPNNDQAYMLKDRVQVSLGGRASVVLSSADEAKYQQAIQELQKNNIVGAYAIVEQLLQKPENKRSTKVLDLQKKVKALL